MYTIAKSGNFLRKLPLLIVNTGRWVGVLFSVDSQLCGSAAEMPLDYPCEIFRVGKAAFFRGIFHACAAGDQISSMFQP